MLSFHYPNNTHVGQTDTEQPVTLYYLLSLLRTSPIAYDALHPPMCPDSMSTMIQPLSLMFSSANRQLSTRTLVRHRCRPAADSSTVCLSLAALVLEQSPQLCWSSVSEIPV
jgi:hypothetical protein